MNKFTLLRAGIAISSLKICPIKETFADFGKDDKLLYYFAPRCYLITTSSKRSIILKSFKHKLG
ncbi:MAG: hypothetical protein ISS77_07455 [Phycisphaerae bacterium]|nr:hypothetical protein [Phycisphaerae bacterium]